MVDREHNRDSYRSLEINAEAKNKSPDVLTLVKKPLQNVVSNMIYY